MIKPEAQIHIKNLRFYEPTLEFNDSAQKITNKILLSCLDTLSSYPSLRTDDVEMR